MPYVYRVTTDKDTHFTGALATNAGEAENLVLPSGLAPPNGQVDALIHSLTILSDQNLAWEVQIYGTDGFDDADADIDSFIGRWTFVAADAVRIAGAGLYRYYIDGLAVPYRDSDKTGELHLLLVNRDAVAKNAGATGEVVVRVDLEPMIPF